MDYQCLVDNMKVFSTPLLVYSRMCLFISVTIQEDQQYRHNYNDKKTLLCINAI